jgi:hypothetical protein
MKPKNLKLTTWLLLLLVSITYKSEANTNETNRNLYFGLQSGLVFNKISDVIYQNLRLTNFIPISSSNRSNRFFYSVLLGIKPNNIPIRIEAELMHNVNSKFPRSYDFGPNITSFPIQHNKIMIKSRTNLINFYFDFNNFNSLIIQVNLGLGATKHKAFAEQRTEGTALQAVSFYGSKKRLTAALGTGVSMQFKQFDLGVGYKGYINKNYFTTGLIPRALNDKFSGKIVSHNIEASIRCWIY